MSVAAGALRSCVTLTWTAVVFDFLEKLHELELAGDRQARATLGEFEKARASGDYFRANQLEEDVLALAKDTFELLTPLELKDLQRLHEDRHRCAVATTP